MAHVHSDAMLSARAAGSAGSVFESHPDFNTISAFFLGCVFTVAFQSLIVATLTQGARLLTRSVNDVEAPRDGSEPTNGSVYERDNAPHILLFAMFLSFSLGSISDLVSLMSGRPEAICAFTVSLGIMTTKIARLLGLIMLLLTAHRLKIVRRWQLTTIICCFLLLFVLILVDGVLNTGTVKVADYLGISFCIRRRAFSALPASLVSSLMYIFLALYFIIRLAMVLLPRLSQRKEPPITALLRDIHLQRACSLLFFELLVVAPSVVPVNNVGFFIPTTIGSLVVLTVFSSKSRTVETEKQVSIMGSFSEKLPASPIRLTASPPIAPSIISHPYSSASLSNPTLLRVEDSAPPTLKSNETVQPVHPSRILQLPADILNGIPRQLSDISHKGRPRLSVITGLSTYGPNNPNRTRAIMYNETENFNDGQSTMEMVYEFYSNTPHTAPLRSRFSPPSDLEDPKSTSTVTPKVLEDPHTRPITHNPGFRPKGPRSQSGDTPKFNN